MRYTCVEPARDIPGALPELGKVTQRFDLPFEVAEIIQCREELVFVTPEGKQISLIGLELKDPLCPVCGTDNDEAHGPEWHTCANPFA